MSTFACGSMVLSVYCVSFFAQLGEKMTHEALNIIGKRKIYINESCRMIIAQSSGGVTSDG